MNFFQKAFSIASPAGFNGKLTIFIFHRVLPKPDPLFPDEPDSKRFDQLMNWISSWFNTLPLNEAALLLKQGLLPSRAACITFDDGYADNFTIALPILKKYNLTATFFISTGFLDGGRMWNDTIIESIRHYSSNKLDLTQIGLESIPLHNTDEKTTSIRLVLNKTKYLPPQQRVEFTRRIAELTKSKLPDDLMMTSDQVRELRKAGMQIGAHTVSHPILAKIDSDSAKSEIFESKIFLEKLLREEIVLFAYPNGKFNTDYLDCHVEMVKELGFKVAVSTSPGYASRNCDLFQIPRFTPWDKNKFCFGGRILGHLVTRT